MTAMAASPLPPQENLRHRLTIGDQVLARRRRSGTEGNWYPGKVTKVARRGAVVETEYGIDFYHWADLRRNPAFGRARRIVSPASAPPPAPPAPDPAPPPSPPTAAMRYPLDPAEYGSCTFLGEMLRRWRHAAGLSQHDAGRLLGASASHYSMCESGIRVLNDDGLLVFAEKSGVDLDAIMTLRNAWSKDAPAEQSPAADTGRVRALISIISELDTAHHGLSSSELLLAAHETPHIGQAVSRFAYVELTALTTRLLGYRLGRIAGINIDGQYLASRYDSTRGKVWLVTSTLEEHAGQEPPDPPAPVEPPDPPVRGKATAKNFLTWSEELQHLVPVPKDRELRQRWFSLVKELYDITKKERA